jgi:acyl-CoA synthetase (AMP-forming)/AMP-acid ligase II
LIASLLEEAPADRPALAAGDRLLTYGDLRGLSARFEEQIAAMGEVRGQRIAFVAPNTAELVAGLFAVWRRGAVAVPLSARLRERELELMLADAEPVVVVSVAAHGGYSFADVLPGILPPSVRALLLLPNRPPGTTSGVRPRFLEATSEPAPLEWGEVAAILYTSGTTGIPKGVLVKHVREVEGARFLAETLRLAPDDRCALIVPISHAFGLTCFHSAVAAGAEAVLVDSSFSPGPLLRALDARSATVLHGSPTLFRTLLKARPGGLPSIRTGLVAGAPCPPDLLEALDARGTRILNCYGLSETGAVTCVQPDDPPRERHTTVGRVAPAYEARIREGELEVAGTHLTPGYYRRPEETAEAFHDGWFRTGDLAEIEDGYVRIVGRAKEIVHVGGFNVVPAEVEAALLAHPDVENAAVLGVPDERMGEALVAYVSPRPERKLTSSDLIAFARARIAGYKVPYAIEILPELPLLPSGKPDRKALSR